MRSSLRTPIPVLVLLIALAAAPAGAIDVNKRNGNLQGDWLIDFGAEQVKTDLTEVTLARQELAKVIPTSLDQQTPDRVAVDQLFAGFHLAKGREIAGGKLRTGDGCQVQIYLQRNQLSIRFVPGLRAYKGPLSTMTDVTPVEGTERPPKNWPNGSSSSAAMISPSSTSTRPPPRAKGTGRMAWRNASRRSASMRARS